VFTNTFLNKTVFLEQQTNNSYIIYYLYLRRAMAGAGIPSQSRSRSRALVKPPILRHAISCRPLREHRRLRRRVYLRRWGSMRWVQMTRTLTRRSLKQEPPSLRSPESPERQIFHAILYVPRRGARVPKITPSPRRSKTSLASPWTRTPANVYASFATGAARSVGGSLS